MTTCVRSGIRALCHHDLDRLHALARRLLGNTQDAQDCVQDALVKTLSAADRFQGRSALFTWVARITLNEAYSRLRGRRSRGPHECLDDHPDLRADTRWCPEGQAAQRQAIRLTHDLLGRLSQVDSAVIRLRTLDGMTTAEAAGALRISETAVKVRLHRAMKRLRNQALTQIPVSH